MLRPWFLTAVLALCGAAHAQVPTPDIAPQPVTGGTVATEGRPIGWGKVFTNIASDQKRIWLFPTELARGRHLLPAFTVLAATAALIGTDAQTAPHFRNTDTFHGFNSVFTSKATDTATLLAPVSLYAVGLITRDSYARNTALLAGEAVADAEIITVIAKDIDRRRRPATYAPGEDMGGSWFNDKGSWTRGHGSFPSGHTIAAFSVATVFARRYGEKRRWVPFVAYGLAGLVGFSRMTLCSHFPSDVLMGGALGYSIGRFAVLRQ